ncbi:MAG: hypothetical protein E7813_05720 [Bradyrhizobium sp.]|uniref:hypothetical protein n=1 Tax=Bradyrhizobium sp. TaxID=376 RepID=UPI00120FABCE|nr:hypothetical protein [Bradyrhizobium sp.]THD71329.1 MAG: hypothetical protein E7813_05720 [Bradyrhizobium sp.]
MSEHQPEQTSGETGPVVTEPAVSASSEVSSEPVAAAASETASVESPALAPEPGETEPAKVDAPKADAVQADVPKVDTPKVEAAKPETPRVPGKVLVMSSADRAWGSHGAGAEAKSEPGSGLFGKRRVAALAAVVALAAVTGALGGALATVALGHLAGEQTQAAGNHALEAQVAQLDADMTAVKASVEHTSKLAVAQFNRANDRLDKVEKAQLEPAVKLAKLSEAIDKLRAAPAAPAVAAAAPVAAKEVTGSISPPAVAPASAPKADVGRLPTVEGWVLRDVANGGALIEGRRGIYEVYAGDSVPGLGWIDAIRRQDGRWVVVTSKGLVVAR